MFENYTALDLYSTLIQLRDDGSADGTARSERSDIGLWTISAFHADNDQALHSHVWERHPTGHEVLGVLSGSLHVYLREAGEDPVATLTAGQAFLVPTGAWHRLSVREPGDLLSITPRAGTEHERMGEPS